MHGDIKASFDTIVFEDLDDLEYSRDMHPRFEKVITRKLELFIMNKRALIDIYIRFDKETVWYDKRRQRKGIDFKELGFDLDSIYTGSALWTILRTNFEEVRLEVLGILRAMLRSVLKA
ncbi:hypothetical protein JCGZ_05957 [Jatropha curcas]|uniref:Uncharacterized protein n=1 Tax=Jatropha curcas TaxID=180498 RepID=A0A067KR74_JATCU|nr:hypothetical protein JCGZ_05957 [Jatropha curcas]